MEQTKSIERAREREREKAGISDLVLLYRANAGILERRAHVGRGSTLVLCYSRRTVHTAQSSKSIDFFSRRRRRKRRRKYTRQGKGKCISRQTTKAASGQKRIAQASPCSALIANEMAFDRNEKIPDKCGVVAPTEQMTMRYLGISVCVCV